MRLLRCGAMLFVCASAGCTVRYSQTITGRIERLKQNPVEVSDMGTEVGLFAPNNVITFHEPRGSGELLMIPCDVALAEVDYRSKWYTYYVSVNFPEVKVISYCVAER